MKGFFTWLRNGFCFATAWFLILMVITALASGESSIKVSALTNMMIISLVGTLLFCLFFRKDILKKWTFTSRLTGFFLSFTTFEFIGMYIVGIINSKTEFKYIAVFIGIILILYFSALMINYFYSKKHGEVYTDALKKYQEKQVISTK